MKNKKHHAFSLYISLFTIIVLYFASGCSFASKNTPASAEGVLFYGDPCRHTEDKNHIFYSMLPEKDRAVYELFHDLVDHKDESGYEVILQVNPDDYEKLTLSHFWNIYYALCYDHPEYFFLLTGDSPRIKAYVDDVSGGKKIRFSLAEATEGENDMVKELEAAAESFLSDIDLSGSSMQTELLIHDKLIDLVSYDYDLYEMDKSSTYCGLSSTAYGALVRNDENEKNTALCGGYALAFEYLCQKAGIPCGYITGMADADTQSETDYSFHAWNIIMIDGNFYETDPTWDDFDITEKVTDKELIDQISRDTDTCHAVTHHYFNRTTAEMEKLEKQEATTFYLEGYNPYNPRSVSSHIRGTYSLGKTDNISMYLNSLLPVATGD